MNKALTGAIPSPNIWNAPRTYETENRAADPEGRIEEAMRAVRPWTGAHVLDIGCGTGFHLPRFAVEARWVTGVEPHRGLAGAARRRVRALPNVTVRTGVAQRLPVADASVDVAHARWAYFFGPGCEPGLAELDRVMRRGGVVFVIDNDATRSTFGGWFRRSLPSYDPLAVERFWSGRGFTRRSVDMGWRFESRADFEAVVRIEFPPALAEEIIDGHRGLEVDYAVNVWWREY
ncbi:class I SAM-dependent methyltransferase [Thermobifida cellulosilytica]|uniref:Methyltransferase type 11 n=1 Tax=Thermobifida cellulosilytica TB100 TaxID=665004 RepID=A0A147KL35_THECS|nr:class I SAM-dependent methyltransferase [Thermobifida cellulosilytica]KUP98040.1 methyltransferase type 11 [Thermobifida cellulosilytica TB100]